jgi:hypothetical protein
MGRRRRDPMTGRAGRGRVGFGRPSRIGWVGQGRGAWIRLIVSVMSSAWMCASIMVMPAVALGASPVPTPEAGGDTRSAGEGPGLVGAPLLAIGGVLALGLVAAGATLAYVRATGGAGTVVRPSAPPAPSAPSTARSTSDPLPREDDPGTG